MSAKDMENKKLGDQRRQQLIDAGLIPADDQGESEAKGGIIKRVRKNKKAKPQDAE